MRGELYHPWRVADEMGMRVIVRELPDEMWGAWHAPSRTVILDRRLSQRERRCTLAHEIVHAEAGDSCRQNAKVELSVHRIAARRLIRREHLAEAARWARSTHELADQLWVDDYTLSVRLGALTEAEASVLERGEWAA